MLGLSGGIDSSVIGVADRHVATDRPLKGVRVIFAARIVGGELRNELGGTTDEARWFPLAEVPSLPRVPLVDAALGMYDLG